jgi:survival of motor neuron-related-splicing factor 30
MIDFVVVYQRRDQRHLRRAMDLETSQVQLAQVELALAADPQNAELSSLRSELMELIELTQAALSQAVSATLPKAGSSRKTAAAVSAHAWTAGDDCMAKFSGDGSWYPARITSIGGSVENRVYSIVFKGYNTTELVKATEIKPIPANLSYGSTPALAKRKLTKAEEEEKEKKKKKNEKKMEAKAAKAKEQLQKQQTWQKFAKKSEKKGVHIAGVSGTSIFKTPDNPLGRGERRADGDFRERMLTIFCDPVGVTGSGKGMTEVASRSKHKFGGTGEAS